MKTFSMLLTLCEVNHWALADSPHKSQWWGALMFCFYLRVNKPVKQTMETTVIWDAIMLIMTSLQWIMEQLECFISENTHPPPCPMITHTINSYWISFIQSQYYIVQGHNYKCMNPTYVKCCTDYYICIKFETFSIKKWLQVCKKSPNN